MLIDTHIGLDEVDGEGIMGPQFVRELMLIDSRNYDSIQVWICTPGGSCMDGEQIYNAILKTKTPVDTYNVGTVASIGGPIFLAGRNRFMGSWAKLMMHPASGGDKKSLDAYNQSVAKMLSQRSFITEEQVAKLMARTTWIMAAECETLGLCTEIEYSDKYNIKNVDSDQGKDAFKQYSKIVNKLIEDKKPIQRMKKVANKLGLIEDSSEDTILAALNKQEVENKSKFDKFVDEIAQAKKERDDATAKYDSLNKDYIETKAKADEFEKKTKDAAAAEMTNKVNALIKNAVDSGKIVNEVEVIKDWTTQAVANFDATKNIIEKLVINKSKPGTTIVNKIDAPADRKTETETPSINLENTNSYVASMNAKNTVKALNRLK